MSTKLIREGRFGTGKVGKTFSVVSSYPRPLLCLSLDEGGLDGPYKDPITWINPKEIKAWSARKSEELPPICAIDLCDIRSRLMTTQWVPSADNKPLAAFVDTVNTLLTTGCPWKTVVVDPITGLSDIIMSAFAQDRSALLADPRKWAPLAGGKVAEMIGVLNQLPAHLVYIFHEVVKENEQTGETRISPLLPGSVRDRIGSLLSQWFYAYKENGKPKLRTNDYNLVKGIGCRWPEGLPDMVGPLYGDIYERK